MALDFSKCRGFTLLELMVVLAIMSIVAALNTPNMMAELNLRRADLSIEDTQTVMDAARSYRIRHGSWPGDSTCSDAIKVLKSTSPPYLAGMYVTNRYNSAYSTSCTASTFSLDQNAVEDWVGYIANSLAGTEVVASGVHQLRTTIGVPGSEAALDGKLSRLATGNAELNRMRTTLLLGGNDINEVRRLNAESASFTGNVSANSLNVEALAQIAGMLSVQGESQFAKTARFGGDVVLQKVVIEGQSGCEAGGLARDASGKPMACQEGAWRPMGGSLDGPYILTHQGDLGVWKLCTHGHTSTNSKTLTYANGRWSAKFSGTIQIHCYR